MTFLDHSEDDYRLSKIINEHRKEIVLLRAERDAALSRIRQLEEVVEWADNELRKVPPMNIRNPVVIIAKDIIHETLVLFANELRRRAGLVK